jgi:hypothetical protein
MSPSKTAGALLRAILLLLLIGGIGFVALTWWALEAGGVAILETEMADGTQRRTHVWFAQPDGEFWVEAGTPENGWYVDVQERPVLTLSIPSPDEQGNELSGSYLAEPIVGSPAHERIRQLLREKYGFRDWWIGVVFDTTQSVAVRLVTDR